MKGAASQQPGQRQGGKEVFHKMFLSCLAGRRMVDGKQVDWPGMGRQADCLFGAQAHHAAQSHDGKYPSGSGTQTELRAETIG